MKTKLSRRDFLKLITAGSASLAFRSQWGDHNLMDYGNLVRITTLENVSVHSQPWDESRILYQRLRDELVPVYYEVESPHGPGYNPLWYRVWRGYIHSAYTQKVDTVLNPVLNEITETGQLSELTVPFSQSMAFSKLNGWEPVYRLYYKSTHWIIDVSEGPDGEAWYLVEDELDKHLKYFVTASHLRPVTDDELAPISPDVPAHKKHIEISLTHQTMAAFEDGEEVYKSVVATGLNYKPPTGISWNTPAGDFNIYSKMPSKHMGDGRFTSDIGAYELPGVPWTCFFAEHGVASHGTYWHTNYGRTMSRGCVNLTPEEAKWFFRWTTPVAAPSDWEKTGLGTRVIVR